jgi:two-component system, NarL family, sensor kinase
MTARYIRLFFICKFWLLCALTSAGQTNIGHRIDSILALAVEDSAKATILFKLGRESWFSRNFPEAKSYINRSLQLTGKDTYLPQRADAYHLLANIFIRQEIFDSAFLSLQYAEIMGNKKFEPLIYETYSRLYYRLGDFPASLDYALKAADLFEQSNDTLLNMQVVYVYLIAGDVLDKLGQDEKALDYYTKAYRKARTSQVNWYLKTPLQKLAQYYLNKNELDRSKHFYDTIINIDRDAPSHEPTMFSHEGVGNIAMKKNDFKNAIVNYTLALDYARRKDLSIHVSHFCMKLGSAFLSGGRLDSAQYYLQCAIRHAALGKDFSALSAAYLHLSDLYRQLNDHPKSLACYKLHKSYGDSILNVEKIRAVNNLEVLYRTRQKETEIMQLQKIDKENIFAIKKRNIYISIAGMLTITLAILILLLRRNYHHKQRLNDERLKQMERQQQVVSLQAMINGQEAERIRVAKDLHDGLGSLFSTIKMHFNALQHELPDLRKNELFQKSYALADSASLEVRSIAHDMVPEVLMKLGLVNAVKDLCDNISAGRQLNVSLEVHGLTKRMSVSLEMTLFRIVQELLNNIMRHAQATEAIVQFTKDGNRLSVIVEDNGRGFDPSNTDGKNHTGMENIKSRIDYLNGKLTVDSQANVGTTVMMDFSINE